MPLQNRVHADGSILAHPGRGSMMGNRGGRIHTAQRLLKNGNPWASQRWICCALRFKGRHRQVWAEGYTELFFLDEVTALAAGHRPCFECRRENALAFQSAIAAAFADASAGLPSADAMDRRLHNERTGRKACPLRWGELPIGAVVRHGRQLLAKGDTGPLIWSMEGYAQAGLIDPGTVVEAVTPPLVMAALRSGYRPHWHATAKGEHFE